MNDINFKLDGLICEACIRLATNRIMKVPGVHNVTIDLLTCETRVYAETNLDLEILAKSLEGTRYLIIKP